MKLLVLSNQARSLVNFWSPLLTRLVDEGHDVLCCLPNNTVHGIPDAGDTEAEAALQRLGVRLRHYPLDRKGLNPCSDAKTSLALYRLFCEERPDLLYASTIKPVIYGLLMAALAGVPRRYAMITGLGYMFEADTPIKKGLTCVAAALYRAALACSHGVFFQNNDDLATFRQWHCLPANANVIMTKGTGVDTVRFAPAPLPDASVVRFLLVGRLLEAKGLYDFAHAARIVRQRYPHAEFQVLGAEEHGRGGVPITQIRAWEEEGILSYLGETRDVRPFLAQASVVVLPSWREGLPCSLMEAMSTGRPLIATDVPGCRDVVVDQNNGLLVPVRNPEALAQAMAFFLEHPEQMEIMGQQGRRMAEQELDATQAVALILQGMHIESCSSDC